MNSRLAPVLLVLTIGLTVGCVATEPSMIPDGQELEARFSKNEALYYSEAYGRWFGPGEYVSFDGYFADGTRLEDELDVWAIAGDEERLARVKQWRNEHNRGILGSWAAVGVGAAALGAGATVFALNASGTEEQTATFLASPLGQGSLGAMAVGGVILGSAYFMYMFIGPNERLHGDGGYDPGLLYEPSESLEILSRYNSSRTATAPAPEAAPAEPAPADAPAPAAAP